MRIGLISDTHGLLRPQALAFLAGCDHIIHAGDIGNARVLATLGSIAPLTAVRGNNDTDAWADTLAESELIHFGRNGVYVIHELAKMTIDPVSRGLRAVITGHSHKPAIFEKNSVLYINPGSAGSRRFKLPVSVGELLVEGTSLVPRLVVLD